MESGTLLGFDYGERRIGIAVGQRLTATARPLETIGQVAGKPDWARIGQLIEQWQPDLLVVGLPLGMEGDEHELSRAARRFANRLNGRFHLPVELVDERLTSIEAERIVAEQRRGGQRRRKGAKLAIDAIAAQLILETYLSGT